MNEEIKEILDNVKKCCDIDKDTNFVVYQKQSIVKLLNYITNLQEENQKLNKIIDELEKWLKERINRYEYSTGNMNMAAAGTLKATLNKLTELKKEVE